MGAECVYMLFSALEQCVHIQDAWEMKSVRDEDSGELLSARDSIQLAKEEGKIGSRTLWQAFMEVCIP